jgi:hypothetical protein
MQPNKSKRLYCGLFHAESSEHFGFDFLFRFDFCLII